MLGHDFGGVIAVYNKQDLNDSEVSFKPMAIHPVGTLLSITSTLINSQINITGYNPINACSFDGIISLISNASGSLSITVSSTVNQIGLKQFGGYATASTGSSSLPDLGIMTRGSIFISIAIVTSGTATFTIYCSR